jgi:hypothetical protein
MDQATGNHGTGDDRIDHVAPGDVITLDRGSGDQPYRVVHKDSTDAGFIVTLEDDGGETFDVDLPGGTTVTRTLESKWESPQSPTPHTD